MRGFPPVQGHAGSALAIWMTHFWVIKMPVSGLKAESVHLV